MWVDDAVELAKRMKDERTSISILRVHALIYEHAPGLCWQPTSRTDCRTRFFIHVFFAARECEEAMRDMYLYNREPDDHNIDGALHELWLAGSFFHNNEQNVRRFLNGFSGE